MTAYLFFVGPRPSLVRAVLMSGTGILWSLLSFGRIDMLRVLALSCVCQIALMPQDVHTLSFGLSYLALFGILGGCGTLDRRLPFVIPPKIRTAAAAALAAQACSAPLLFAVFGEVHPVGIISSILLTPMVMVLMAMGIVYLVFSASAPLWPPVIYTLLDGTLGSALGAVSGFIGDAASHLARAPSIRFPGEGGGTAAAVWTGVLTLFVLLHYRAIIASVRRFRYAHTEEPRFSSRDRPVPPGGGTGAFTPVWAELPRQPEGEEEDRGAA
jgi:ComEC/Rec2-related protein